MRDHRLHLLTTAAVVLLPAVRPLRAGDAPRDADPSEVRSYPIGALVRPHPRFTLDQGPFSAGPFDAGHRPLYGGEGAEVEGPVFGGIDDRGTCPRERSQEALQSALEAGADSPQDWQTESTEILVEEGPDVLFVRAPARLQAQVAAQLAEWAREDCVTLVLDVALLEGDAAAAGKARGLAAAVHSGALLPLAFARVLPSTHGNGAVRDGGRWAYLHDYDTLVACECNAPDPSVAVAPEGFAVRAWAVPTAGGRWSVSLEGWWASAPAFAPRRMQGGRTFGETHRGPVVPPPAGGDVFEAISSRGEGFCVPLALSETDWALVPLSEHRVLAVRLHVERPSLPAWTPGASAPPPDLAGEICVRGEPPPALGAASPHTYEVEDLLRDVESRQGFAPILMPSNFTPRPDEILSPWPGVTVDALRWLVERAAGPEVAEDLRCDPEGGRLTVRADDARARAVERLLADLRSRRLRTTRVEATVVTLPLTSVPEAWTDPDAVLSGGMPALLSRPGARVVDRAGLDLRDGQRLAAVVGQQRPYVSDYDVEIACTTTIGNPIVSNSVFSGVSLDLQASQVLSSPLVSVLVRFDRSVLLRMRSLPTRFGEIEAPVTRDQSLRGTILLAPGETRLFGFSASGEEAMLVLLSRPPP